MIAPPVTPMWTVHPRRDAERARALARALDAPIAVGEALVNRGVEETESAHRARTRAREVAMIAPHAAWMAVRPAHTRRARRTTESPVSRILSDCSVAII